MSFLRQPAVTATVAEKENHAPTSLVGGGAAVRQTLKNSVKNVLQPVNMNTRTTTTTTAMTQKPLLVTHQQPQKPAPMQPPKVPSRPTQQAPSPPPALTGLACDVSDLDSSDSMEISSPPAKMLASVNVLLETNPSFTSPKIDAKDVNDIMTCSEYIKDIYEHFREIERARMPSQHYMKKQQDINEKMRAILVDWLVDVHHKFRLLPETLYLTINLIDRFLSQKQVSRQKLQLVGVTAMLIASKYEEVYSIAVKEFIVISAKAYTRDEILKMERLMLATLGFTLTVPTTYPFLKRFLKASAANIDITNQTAVHEHQRLTLLSYYFSEIALLDFKLLRFVPSMLAASSVFLALRYLHLNKPESDIWTDTMVHYTMYTQSDLMECVKSLHVLGNNLEKSKLQAIRKKYLSPKRLEVASIIQNCELKLE